MKSIRVYITLIAASIGILAALLIAPSTRWLVLPDFQCAVGARPNIAGMDYTLSYARKSVPNEFGPQLFAADYRAQHDNSGNFLSATDLRTLETRYPDRPAVVAAILDAELNTTLDRPDLDATIKGAGKIPSSPQLTDQTLRDAETGERLDPHNAFFPIMRAATLFGAHRDAEALAEMHRAAGASTWNDYTSDVTGGGYRMGEVQIGAKTGLEDVAIEAAVLEPSLVYIRDTSNMAVAHARQLEDSRRRNSALAIRYDVIKCGSLIRTQATNTISVWIGHAFEINGLSLDNPATRHNQTKSSPEQHLLDRQKAFDAYLKSLGRPQDIPTIDAECQSILAQRKIVTDYQRIDHLTPLASQEGYCLIASMVLWMGICSLVIYGGLIALGGKWLPNSRTPYAVGIAASMGAFLGSMRGSDATMTGGMLSALVLYGSVFVLAARAHRQKRFDRPELMAAAIVAIAWTAAFGHGIRQVQMASQLVGMGGQNAATIWDQSVICLTVLLPLLVGFASLIGRRLTRKQPGRALGPGTVVLASVMVAVYAGCVLRTVALDHGLGAYFRAWSANEVAYDAKETGQTLPRPTNWSQLRY